MNSKHYKDTKRNLQVQKLIAPNYKRLTVGHTVKEYNSRSFNKLLARAQALKVTQIQAH